MTCKTCNDTRRVYRYIGHPGRMAEFICFDCETPADREARIKKMTKATEEPDDEK